MQLIDDILYFNYSEIVPKVLNAKNYMALKLRGNINVLGRGGNGREVLIEATSLPSKYQALAKELVCGNMEPGEYYLKSQLAQWLPVATAKDKEAIWAYRIQQRKDDYDTGEVKMIDKEGLPKDVIDKYILESRWINLMIDGYNQYKHALKTLGINSKEQFHTLCISIANANGMKFGRNMTAFKRDKLGKYKKQGIVGIVSGKYGNKNTEKISELQLQTLIDLFGLATKPSTKKVAKAFNTIAVAQGWDEVTEQTVYNNLHKPEVKQVWTLGRHGHEVWKRDYQYNGTRFRATLPNALWIGDDTKVNLFYMDGKGLKASLQVYAIVDSHSGYWLGRSYAENKKGKSIDAEDVRNCFGDSVVKSGGVMPFQMLYDNDGANKFYDRLNTLHFPCMPYNGQSKYIERMFRKVQEEYMAYDEAFTGMNIQSKTDQSKRVVANVIPYATKEDAIRAMELWFEVMNNTKDERTGMSPKEKYVATKNEEARKMTDIDAFEILYEWNERTITMTGNGIKMQHNKREYIYDILTPEESIDVAFYEQHVRRAFKVKYNPRDLSKIALYTTDERFVGIAVDKYKLAEAVQDYRPDERKKINETLEAKKIQKASAIKKLQIASDVSDAEMLLGIGHQFVPKNVLNQAEADMYTNAIEQPDIEDYTPINIEAERRARLHR